MIDFSSAIDELVAFGYLTVSGDGVTREVDGVFTSFGFTPAFDTVAQLESYHVSKQAEINTIKQARIDAANAQKAIEQAKLDGVEFEGVMYSATREDQNGLTAIFTGISGGLITGTNFQFENGAKLYLDQSNLSAFAQVWTAFRQSFFEDSE